MPVTRAESKSDAASESTEAAAASDETTRRRDASEVEPFQEQDVVRRGGPAVGLRSGPLAADDPGTRAKLAVNEPGDKYEKEAERVADAVIQRSEQGDSPVSHSPLSVCALRGRSEQPPVIQRQSGGVRVSSPAISETLKQAGSAAGAIEGRRLTPAERDLAESVFKGSIDYDRVRLGTSGPTWTTTGNVIFVPDNFAISKSRHAQTFIHEMAHVWQYQHGGSEYISISLGRQLGSIIKTGSRSGAYDYTIRSGASIFDYMPEQQASIVETYFTLRRRKARLKKAGKPVPSNLKSRLKRHERLVKELTAALPRSEVKLMERAVEPMQSPVGKGDPQQQPPMTVPLIRVRF